MLKPASIKEIPHHPITADLAIGAVVVTSMQWAGKSIGGFVMDVNVWDRWELWRAFTSIFPHVDPLHLIFNIYWTWTFGTVVERAFGHLRFLGIVAVLAVTSACAEFAVFEGGVGLSGVGYGLWGVLWVLSRRDSRFAGVVDSQTNRMFVGWFFFCIVLTVTKILPVANVAHGIGAIMGVLLGFAIAGRGLHRMVGIMVAAILSFLVLAGSTIWWPHVNRSGFARTEIERAGVDALLDKNNDRGVRLLEISVHMHGAPARAWYNLGIGYQRRDEYQKALAAYEQAARLPDADEQMRKAAETMKDYLAVRPEKKGNEIR